MTLKEKILMLVVALLPDMADLLVFGGLAIAVYGVALIYAPAAWIMGGGVLFWLGIRRH